MKGLLLLECMNAHCSTVIFLLPVISTNKCSPLPSFAGEMFPLCDLNHSFNGRRGLEGFFVRSFFGVFPFFLICNLIKALQM